MSNTESGKALVVALSLVLAFGALAFGWIWYQGYAEAAEFRGKALRSAEIELAAEVLDRETAGLALRQLRDALAAEPGRDSGSPPADELVRKMAELQLALGQSAQAWETIAAYASGASAVIEDVLLGSRACTAIYAARGTKAEGLEALGLVKRHYELSGDQGSLFLACLLAYRLTEVAEFYELRASIIAGGDDSREARALLALSYSLAVHLSERVGFAGGEDLVVLAQSESRDDRNLLARIRVEASEASAAGDLAALQELEGEFADPLPELEVVTVEALVGRAGASEEDLREGLDRLEAALQAYPSYLEARNISAVIHYALGEKALCEGQLRWLLKNATPEDLRRNNWQQMLQ
ncbi:MAG: hypothetical protein ACYTG5_20105 [Planctomycetota bacterium]|jgi:hypothetical protein